MSMLCKLVRKIFIEFYNPSKSMSAQMTKFSNLMVYYVIQGREFEDIYAITRRKLEEHSSTRVSGYINQEDYMKNQLVRKNSSLLFSNSCSSLNLSHDSDSFNESNFDKSSGSETSLIHSSTSKNNQSCVLRENFLGRGNISNKKHQQPLFGGSDSNLSKISSSTPSNSNILKAKRQISF
jgi:hypothetical protein